MDEKTHATDSRLVLISKAQDLLANDSYTLSRLLTPAELAQASARENPAEYLAGHLAAKAAAADALARLLPEGLAVDPLELETLDAPSGAPVCTVHGSLSAAMAARGMSAPRVSITNEAEAALAIAVIVAPAAGGEGA